MCGIVGYVGPRNAREVLVDGLKRLEYRGYDSAGLAMLLDGVVDDLNLIKKAGTIDLGLEVSLRESASREARSGIGHTRWATHGAPNDANAHPHSDCSGRIAVVHNGIIENYAELRDELREAGHRFLSETDTEVIPHLIEHYRNDGLDLLEAVARAVQRLEGAYALAVLDGSTPGVMVGVRKNSPLIVGLGEGEHFLASDVPAILPYTRDIVILENGDMVAITSESVCIHGPDGEEVRREARYIDWDPVMAEREGYPHFMLKEIEEQPESWRSALRGRVADGRVSLPEIELSAGTLKGLSQVYLVACGTSYHAGVAAAPLFERMLQVPVRAVIASEFRYGDYMLDEGSLVILISQSGETADTLACQELALERGCPEVTVTNVVGSSMERGSDNVIYTRAGPEISVASTKTYTTQMLILYLLACELGRRRGAPDEAARELLEAMPGMPGAEESLLDDAEPVLEAARYLAGWDDVFFIGRGLDYAAAMEGQLKLKEISYIHAEAYPAGELKHGTLALIEPGVPVVAISTQGGLRDKVASNIEEVRARGAHVVLVTDRPGERAASYADMVIPVPAPVPELAPFFVGTALQLLAYHTAVLRDCPVDKPRNLAKSVTVE
ncbi:MAG: glutamine--fructose-6-phosphate transaminase (isomerizing) [Bacillota bacterium]